MQGDERRVRCGKWEARRLVFSRLVRGFFVAIVAASEQPGQDWLLVRCRLLGGLDRFRFGLDLSFLGRDWRRLQPRADL